MFKNVQIPILFGLLCAGCDSAAKQQQAEDARREATAAELKQIGQSMHERQNNDTSPAGAAIRNSDPQPLAENETLGIYNAIHVIAPGDISNLKQNRDGTVTAFVSSGPCDKRTVVVTKVGDKWKASVTMVYF